MTGGHKIRSIGAGSEIADSTSEVAADDAAADALQAEDQPAWDEDWEEAPASSWTGWIFPLLASFAILGWSAFFVWTNRNAILSPASPQQWIDWVGQWSLPVALNTASPNLAGWAVARQIMGRSGSTNFSAA